MALDILRCCKGDLGKAVKDVGLAPAAAEPRTEAVKQEVKHEPEVKPEYMDSQGDSTSIMMPAVKTES